MRHAYLVGPIAGCDSGEAKDWRAWVTNVIAEFGVKGISPLRCEPLITEHYELSYEDPRFGTANAIAAKNEYDTRACDIVFAYLPRELNERRPSYGSVIELAWAHMLGKQVILVTDDPYMLSHPLVQAVTSWRVETLQEGVDIIEGIFSDYG